MQILLYDTNFVPNEKHKLIHLLKKKKKIKKKILATVCFSGFISN